MKIILFFILYKTFNRDYPLGTFLVKQTYVGRALARKVGLKPDLQPNGQSRFNLHQHFIKRTIN